jgi:hypothetical protein
MEKIVYNPTTKSYQIVRFEIVETNPAILRVNNLAAIMTAYKG